jgi:hypothetical protein
VNATNYLCPKDKQLKLKTKKSISQVIFKSTIYSTLFMVAKRKAPRFANMYANKFD